MTKEQNPAFTRKRLLLGATLFFTILGLGYLIWWFIVASHYESTDDAYVHGDLVQVTSQIAGTVVAIHADDTQLVSRGTPLIRLDTSDTDVALKQAQAALAQTVRRTKTLYVQNDALQADIDLRQANVESAKVELAKAENDLKRRQTLAKSGGISGEEILHALTAVKAARSSVAQTLATLAASKATLEMNLALTAGTDIARHPDVLQAADRLRKAWLASVRTVLPAPVNGMVAQRSVQVGQHVTPGAPLMTIVPLHKVWVEANFKEGQVTSMKPGQKVSLTADFYGGTVTYQGQIQGIAAGTGGAFALLPAQNASGNWIKVVQRVPVRIMLDAQELDAHPLRVGLSMSATVNLSSPGRTPQADAVNSTLETQVFDADKADIDALIAKIIHENL